VRFLDVLRRPEDDTMNSRPDGHGALIYAPPSQNGVKSRAAAVKKGSRIW